MYMCMYIYIYIYIYIYPLTLARNPATVPNFRNPSKNESKHLEQPSNQEAERASKQYRLRSREGIKTVGNSRVCLLSCIRYWGCYLGCFSCCFPWVWDVLGDNCGGIFVTLSIPGPPGPSLGPRWTTLGARVAKRVATLRFARRKGTTHSHTF